MGECVGEEGGGRRYEYVFHPSISLHGSANRSQRVFVSALLLPFFPYPPEQADAFSRCQHSFHVCLCVYVCVKWPIFVELALLSSPPPKRVGLCDIDAECVAISAVLTFNDCANEWLIKAAPRLVLSLLSLTQLP